MTDVDPVLSAAPYRRRDLTDLATVLSNLATYWKRNKKKIRAEGSRPYRDDPDAVPQQPGLSKKIPMR